jgi:DNA polymerase-3 subunit alpha
MVQRLAEILAPYRGGRCAVGVRYWGEQASCALELSREWGVRADPALLESLEQVVGREGVRVVYGAPIGVHESLESRHSAP